MQKKYLCSLITATFFISHSFIGFAGDATTDKAADLLKARNYEAAYQLLEPLESDRAGDVEYDYLFGVAAVENGNVTRGVFALERVLALQPNNVAARSEIAKAYFKLGETETSKSEFNNILALKPEKELSDAIDKYMSAIDKSLGLTRTFGAFVDIGFGYDSNISSGTSSSTITAPGIASGLGLPSNTPFSLNQAARERSSGFTNLTGGLSFRQPVDKNIAVFGSVIGNNKINTSTSDFDTTSIDFNLGASYKKFVDTYSVGLQGGQFNVDGDRFRKSLGATGQWQHDIDDRNQASIYAQYSHLTYPSSSVRDGNRYIIGGGWGHLFTGDKAPFIYLGAYGGQEKTDDSSFDFLSNDIYGIRLGGQFVPNYKTVVFASSSYESRRYDAQDTTFLATRDDDQVDLSVGLKYKTKYNWIIKPQISYLRNSSNIALYEFERTVVGVNFRRDFDW